eukprot:gene1532-2954_t
MFRKFSSNQIVLLFLTLFAINIGQVKNQSNTITQNRILNILLYHPHVSERKQEISYEALHFASGYSGTETALIEVASYLSNIGNGVSSYFFNDPLKSSDITPSTSTSIISIPHISSHHHVPAITSEPFQFQFSPSRQGKWIFHATMQRGGGRILERIFTRVRKESTSQTAKELHYASYYTSDHTLPSSNSNSNSNKLRNNKGFSSSLSKFIFMHGSLSKQNIAKLLWNVEYFIYPLVLPWGMVHHDTFGTVVLEALSAGVLVLSWDVACLSDVYSNYIELLPIKVLNNDSYDPFGRFGSNKWLLSDEAVNAMATAILRLERDPVEKQRRRVAGIDWARNHTWDRIGEKYSNWFSSMSM